MSGISRGFSLLELVIVIAIIAIIGVVAIPRFSAKKTEKIDTFFSQLNVLTKMAHTNAQITGAVHRILFDVAHDIIIIEKTTGAKTASGDLVFEPIKSEYLKNSIAWPDDYDLRNFYIKGADELKGGKTNKVWFYIVPEGVGQQIVINIAARNDSGLWSFVLNPFTLQFKKYDEIQKPSA
jgi:prepilin-type N-terminal cleavage/methylation domain-containing protein